MLRVRRVLAILAIAVLAAVVVALLTLHTPVARSRVFAWVTGLLESRYGLVLTAGDVRYNALTGTATLRDVRLAARGHEAEPFLVAAELHADVPLATYRGRLILDDVQLTGARLAVHRAADGTSNLPAGSGVPRDPSLPALKLDVRGLHLRDLAVSYVDEPRRITVTTSGITADLDPGRDAAAGIGGPFGVAGGIAVQWRDRTLQIAPLQTTLAFDGSGIALDGMPIVAPELRATLSGRLDRLLDTSSFDLRIDGVADLARLVEWQPPPIAVAGALGLQGSLSGVFADPTLALVVNGSSVTLGTETDVNVSGPVTLTADEVTSDGIVLTPATGGNARASFAVPFADTATRAEVTWTALDVRSALRLGEVEPQPIGAALDGRLTYVSLPTRSLTFSTSATPRTGRGLAALGGTVTGALQGNRLTLVPNLQSPGVTATGTLALQLGEARAQDIAVAADTRVTVTNLRSVAQTAAAFGVVVPGFAQEISGTIAGPVKVGGTFARPEVTASLQSSALQVPSLGSVTVSADIFTVDDRIVVSPLVAGIGGTTVGAEVSMHRDTQALEGNVRLNTEDIADVLAAVPASARLSGPATMQGTLSGSASAPLLDIALTGSQLTVGGQPIDTLAVAAQVTQNAVLVSSIEARQGAAGGSITGHGTYDWEGAYTVALDATNLTWRGALLPGSETTATAGGHFEGTGTIEAPMGTGNVQFAVAGGVAGGLIGEGTAAIVLTGADARILAQVPALGAFMNGTIDVQAPYEYTGVAVLNRVDLSQLAPLGNLSADQLTGVLNLTASANGALQGARVPQAFANLQGMEATIAGIPVSLAAPARVAWQPDSLSVSDLDITVGSGSLTGAAATDGGTTRVDGSYDGEVSELITIARAFGVAAGIDGAGKVTLGLHSEGDRDTARATVNLADGVLWWDTGLTFTQLTLDAVLDKGRLTVGKASGHVAANKFVGDVSATADATVPTFATNAITGSLVVQQAAFEAAGLPLTQERPSRISMANGVVTVDDMVWDAAGSLVYVWGNVDLRPEDSPLLGLFGKGTASLRVLSALTPTLAVDGTVDMEVAASGSVRAPVLSGDLYLQNGELAVASPRLLVSDVFGPITIGDSVVRIAGLRGSANGGELTIDGMLRLDGVALAGGSVQVQAQNVALEFPQGLRSEIDGLVTYNVGEGSSLVGDVRVRRSSFTETISLAAFARSGGADGPRRTEPSALDNVRLNVGVSTVEDVFVDNNYGRLEGGGAIRVVGTIGSPGMTGRFSLREGGTVYLAGNTFSLTRGDISFTNLTRIEPDFNIEAETRAGGSDVTMAITGTVDRLAFNLSSSDTSKSQEELASELLGGGSTSESAVAILSSDLLGVTGRRVGLDTVRVDRGNVVVDEIREDSTLIATDVDPGTRLTISKRIRPNVEFTVSQNLRESGKTAFIINYFPLRNLELRGVSGDDADYGIGLRHQVTFGGGAAGPVRTRAAAVNVDHITFSGDPTPLTDADLRDAMTLKAGDTFDFYESQKDLDRLKALFEARGYLEARVRSTRRENPDTKGVDLNYAIERGPHTTLIVQGTELPEADLQAIRTAWSRSVFDRFFVQDAEGIVRRHILRSGYLDAGVTGTMVAASDDKTLTIVVSPGIRVARHEIRFRGNTAVATKRLDEVVKDINLGADAFLNPTAVTDEVARFYRGEGYLAAVVTAAPLEMDGAIGVQPIVVVEGPHAIITDVQLNGVAEGRAADMRTLIDIAPSQPYVSATIDAARLRVERRYRQRGFNAVEVNVAATVSDDSSTVALAYNVNEGPRQVLREVVTVGATRTREGSVRSALRLGIDQPVNLEEWSRARKRLYDTNVFRQVEIEPVPMGEPVDGVQQVRAQVTVQEYPVWRLRYGLQLNREQLDESDTGIPGVTTRETKLGVTAELRNQNLFGRALTAGAAAAVQRDYYNTTVFLSNASFFGLPVRSSVFGFHTDETLRADDEVIASTDRVGATFEQRWRRRRLELTYAYRYEARTLTTPALEIGEIGTNLGRLSSAVVYDRRPDPLNPGEGTFSSFSLERAGTWLGGDVAYTKLLGQQLAFVPWRRLVFATRAQIGKAFASDVLLLNDRFLAGGGSTIRGYGENSLGPRDASGLPNGGDGLVVLNQELRFPVYRWVGAVAFLDAGNVLAKGEALTLGGLKIGYGLGLRFSSPVGLLRVDYGIAGSTLPSVLREANRLGAGRWYFGLGHIF